MMLDLVKYGFEQSDIPSELRSECVQLLRRQTLNTNRAICVIQLDELPKDVNAYLRSVRTKVAFRIGFFPLLWGLGLQVVLICPGATSIKTRISDFVDKVDNQWAIIQSIFFVDPVTREFVEARTWGQFVTGQFQDEISRQLVLSYRNVSGN